METGCAIDGRYAPVNGRLRSHRSAISNGARLFTVGDVDGRGPIARRFKDVVVNTMADLGGRDVLSEAQLQLIRRAAALSVMCESAEVSLVNDQPFDVQSYLAATTALRRVLVSLGLERRPRDVSPDLSAYLQPKAQP